MTTPLAYLPLALILLAVLFVPFGVASALLMGQSFWSSADWTPLEVRLFGKPARRKPGWLLKIIRIVLLLGVVITSIFLMAYVAVSHEQARAVRQTTQYLEALQEGDFGAAYRRLCSQDQEGEALPAFIARQMTRPRLRDYEIVSTRGGSSFNYVVGPVVLEVDLLFVDGTRSKERYAAVYGDCLSPAPADEG